MLNSLRNYIKSLGHSRASEDHMNASEAAMLSRLPNTKEREFIEARLGVPIHRFHDFRSYLETGHKKVWATFRSCRLISACIVSATFKMVKDGDDDTAATTKEHGWFISKPNPYDSWEEMLEMWTFHMELVGNAYWLKDEPDILGRPKALYPLLPQNVKVVPDKNKKVAKYIYSVNGREIEFKPEEIIHFKSVNPVNLHIGMGSIEPSQDLYNAFINKNVLDEKFVENGAILSGVLTKEDAQEDEDEWKALKKKFNLEYSGKQNAGKVAFLNGKWSYHKLGMTMRDMQALENEKWNVEQIFLNHGVPLSVAGIKEAANYATSRQDEINFRRYKVVPLIDILVGKLNADGFLQAGGLNPTLRLAYEMSGLIDVEQIVKEYKPLVELGAMTPNELREMCNLPISDNPYLDQFFVPVGFVPIEIAGLAGPTEEDINDEIKALRLKRRKRAIQHD